MGQSAWLSTSLYNLQGIEGQSQCDGARSYHLPFAYNGKTLCSWRNFIALEILHNGNTPSRMLKKTRLRTRPTQAGPQRAITYYFTKGLLG